MILFLSQKLTYLNPIVGLCLSQPPIWFLVMSSWLSECHQAVMTIMWGGAGVCFVGTSQGSAPLFFVNTTGCFPYKLPQPGDEPHSCNIR